MARIVALTGGIGSGKSTVAEMFVELGAVVIDADAIVHELQASGAPLLEEIAEAFGREVLDPRGALDREALAGRIFRDAEARARLGALVHPKVGAEMARRVAAAREAGAELIVLEIPVLFEARRAGTGGASGMPFDAVIVVVVPEELQVERQLARESYDREEALRRIRAQIPLEEKERMATYAIDNSGAREETRRQVRRCWERLTGRAPDC